jgi:hypothetical protein
MNIHFEREAEQHDQGEGEQSTPDSAVEPKADQEAGGRHDDELSTTLPAGHWP